MPFFKRLVKAITTVFRKKKSHRKNRRVPAKRRRIKKKTARRSSAKPESRHISAKRKAGRPASRRLRKTSRPHRKKKAEKKIIRKPRKKIARILSRKTHKRKLRPAGKKKSAAGKALKNAPAKPAQASQEDPGVLIGEVTHYFSKIMVCVVKMKGAMQIGDMIRIKGHSAQLVQKVESLQVESLDVKTARKGQLVGLKVKQVVREGDVVYKIKP